VKYTVEIAGRLIEVEIERAGATLTGKSGDVVRRLVRGAKSRSFQARGDGGGLWRLTADGQRLDALVLDPRARAVREAGTAAAAPHKGTLRAPMPGKVLRIPVEAGQLVSPGQALIVVEAMKMENELKATSAGTVGQVHVKAGDTVDKGEVLIELE